MKQKTLFAAIAVLAVLTIVFGVLYFTSNANKTKTIETLTADKTALTDDVAAKTEQVSALEGEKEKQVTDHAAAIAEKDAEIAALTADNTALKAEKEQLMADHAAAIAEKDTEIAALTADKETLVAEKATLEEENSQLTTLKHDLIDETVALEEAANAKDGEIAALIADKEALTAEKEQLVTDHAAAIAEKDAEIAVLTADKEALTAEKEQLMTDHAAAIAEKDEEIAVLTADKEALTAEKEQLVADHEATIAEKDAEIAVLTADKEALTAEKEQLVADHEATIAEKDAEITDLKTETAEQKERIAQLEAGEVPVPVAMDEPSIVGVWVIDLKASVDVMNLPAEEEEMLLASLGEDYENVYEFFADGRVIKTVTILGETDSAETTYVLDGNNIIYENGHVETYQLEGDRLIIGEGIEAMFYDRQ